MARAGLKVTYFWIPTRLLKRLEKAVPPYLRGGRKHKMRVEYALEQFIEAQSAKTALDTKGGLLAKAG